VVDDVGDTEAAHQVELVGPADTGDLGTVGDRDLRSEMTDAAGAPSTSTFWPGRTAPRSRTACRAAYPEIGTVAACSNERVAGLGASLAAVTAAYSA
jgi:hypothetical protein